MGFISKDAMVVLILHECAPEYVIAAALGYVIGGFIGAVALFLTIYGGGDDDDSGCY